MISMSYIIGQLFMCLLNIILFHCLSLGVKLFMSEFLDSALAF
jgi:hypothetical protein